MGEELLDELPIELLMALRDAVADPTEEGRARAAARAADAGFYLKFDGGIPTIEMGPAPEGVEALHLRFDDTKPNSNG